MTGTTLPLKRVRREPYPRTADIRMDVRSLFYGERIFQEKHL